MEKFTTIIDNLREKPASQRKLIVLASSLFLTGFIAVVWISTFSLIPQPGSQVVADTTATPAQAAQTSAGLVLDALKGFFHKDPSASTAAQPQMPAAAVGSDVQQQAGTDNTAASQYNNVPTDQTSDTSADSGIQPYQDQSDQSADPSASTADTPSDMTAGDTSAPTNTQYPDPNVDTNSGNADQNSQSTTNY